MHHLDYASFCRVLKILEPSGNLQLKHNGELILVRGFLGAGWAKRVFDVELAEENFALARPTTGEELSIDWGFNRSNEQMFKIWQQALREPSYTKIIRDIGLCTNNYYEVITVEVGTERIPMLLSTRYIDLPWMVVNIKNKEHQQILPFPKEELTETKLIKLLDDVLRDLACLLRENIFLRLDSLNFCLTSSKTIRLFLLDLAEGNGFSKHGQSLFQVKERGFRFYSLAVIVNWCRTLSPTLKKSYADIFIPAYDYQNQITNLSKSSEVKIVSNLHLRLTQRLQSHYFDRA